MKDYIDKFFEKNLQDTGSEFFICDKCKEKRPLRYSALLPQRGSNRVGRLCYQCLLKVGNELKF